MLTNTTRQQILAKIGEPKPLQELQQTAADLIYELEELALQLRYKALAKDWNSEATDELKRLSLDISLSSMSASLISALLESLEDSPEMWERHSKKNRRSKQND